MPGYSASDLACWISGAWEPAAPASITGVCIDTRSLAPGNVFFALKGEHSDGHQYVAAAFARGAAGAVVRRDAVLPSPVAGCLLRVDDPLPALQRMAAAYRDRLDPEIIAVSGSTGKTTVKEMLAEMLATAQPTARTRGNWNNEIGIPLSLLTLESDQRIGVFEVGISHPGEMLPLARMLKPKWGVITHIGSVHLEFFGAIEAIAREKACLLEELNPRGGAVVARDTPCFEIFQRSSAAPVVTVAMEGIGDYVCVSADLGPADSRIVIRESASGDSAELRVPVAGEHNVRNAALAVAAARQHGVSWNGIQLGLDRFRPLPMRWECRVVRGVHVVNDAYNANPVNMRAALKTFARLRVAGGKWLVLGGMLELGPVQEQEHRLLGEEVAQGPWKGIVTVGALGELIAEGARAAGVASERLFPCPTSSMAAEILAPRLRAGDAVLFKASRGIRIEEALARWIEIVEGKTKIQK